MPVKGGYLLLTGGGIILAWSGLRGKSWSQTLRALISGQSTTAVATAYTIQGSSGVMPAGNTSQIASDALRYQGASYVWGGAPGSGAGNWDCSSFVNAVIGRDLGMTIPGYAAGTYRGQSHGPNTVVWQVWPGASAVSLAQAQPGDLAVWWTHMGIITDNGQHMISALNPTLGTQVTTIKDGAPPLQPLRVRRLHG